jgi:hypothetical protein
MYHPPPQPPQRKGFLHLGVGGAVVLIALSVVGTCARIHNRRHHLEVEEKQANLPAVGSQGTLAKAGANARLCDVPKNAFHFGWPCSGEKSLPADSKVRVMKAGMSGTDAICRYWVQSGPADNASGDAPCEWFVAQ